MADTVASPLISSLRDRLSYAMVGSTRFRIWEKTLSNLWLIEARILDDERVPEREMEVKKWLKEVSDVAYKADDLIDEIEFHIHKIGNNFFFLPIPSCFRVVLSLFPYQTTSLLLLKLRRTEASLVQLVHKYNIICRGPIHLKDETEGVGSVRRHLDTVSFVNINNVVGRNEEKESRGPIHLKAETEGVGSVIRHLGTVSSVFISDVVGRKEEKETIVGWLLESTYAYPFSVVEIVGMGGIGKTTLAQLVYNDDTVCRHFEFMAWVCVSQEFDVMRIAREILEAATIIGSYSESLEVLGKELIEVLRSKRFLIVLDDVWAEIHDKNWSILMMWFGVGSRGSKVLLTSRGSKVAAFPSEHRSGLLGQLSQEDCWSLFQRHASLERYEDEGGKDKIFKGIVAKCKGLPLAVRILARLMRLKRTVQEYLSMVEIDIFQLEEFKLSVLGSLGMSYNHLPRYLKPCFAFCSVFPKGCSITKEKLIQFWISNRLIGKPTFERCLPLEKIGSFYFEELMKRSFFMDVSRDVYGDMSTTCRMHDFIHELALSVAGSWCSVLETGSLQRDISDELHHSSLIYVPGEPLFLESLHQAKNLRTLLFFSSVKLDKIPTGFIQGFRCMRVLDLSQTGLYELHVSVGHLIHLRYLDLSHTNIKILPTFIAKLKYLETLQLAGCIHLEKLPNAISKLTNLRNLDIRSCCLLLQMPFGIGKLRHLQTLPRFLLSEADGCGSLNDLGGLSLRGRLHIENLEHVRNLAEVDDAKLYEKLDLSSLGLSWGPDSPERKMCNLVLEKLITIQYLKLLDIIGYRGSFPSWLCDMMLVKLSLIDCYCDKLPPLGRLPRLRYLHVKGLSRVQSIGGEFYGHGLTRSFQSLKHLELYDMPNLVEWKITEADVPFPCLEVLSIRGCPKLAELPLLPGLRKLALSNCNLLLLQSLAHLTSLSSLVINDFRDHSVLSLKLGSLKSITALTIYNCNSLICVLDNVIREFSSLENLRILYCKELKSLPIGMRNLISLRKLEIIGCQDLVDMKNIEPCFYGIRELTIEDCPNLVSLPEDSVQSLIDSHQKVMIKGCPKLDTDQDVVASD